MVCDMGSDRRSAHISFVRVRPGKPPALQLEFGADADGLERIGESLGQDAASGRPRAVGGAEPVEPAVEPVDELVHLLLVAGDEVGAADDGSDRPAGHRFRVLDGVAEAGVSTAEDDGDAVGRLDGEGLVVRDGVGSPAVGVLDDTYRGVGVGTGNLAEGVDPVDDFDRGLVFDDRRPAGYRRAGVRTADVGAAILGRAVTGPPHVGVTVDRRVVEMCEGGVEAAGVVVVAVAEDDGLGVEGVAESGGVLGDDTTVAGVEEYVADAGCEPPLATEAAWRRRSHAVVGQYGERYHRHPRGVVVGHDCVGSIIRRLGTEH